MIKRHAIVKWVLFKGPQKFDCVKIPDIQPEVTEGCDLISDKIYNVKFNGKCSKGKLIFTESVFDCIKYIIFKNKFSFMTYEYI